MSESDNGGRHTLSQKLNGQGNQGSNNQLECMAANGLPGLYAFFTSLLFHCAIDITAAVMNGSTGRGMAFGILGVLYRVPGSI